MKTYIIGLIVRGKTGREYGLPLEVQAEYQLEAILEARMMAEADGFEVIRIDYQDDVSPKEVEIE